MSLDDLARRALARRAEARARRSAAGARRGAAGPVERATAGHRTDPVIARSRIAVPTPPTPPTRSTCDPQDRGTFRQRPAPTVSAGSLAGRSVAAPADDIYPGDRYSFRSRRSNPAPADPWRWRP